MSIFTPVANGNTRFVFTEILQLADAKKDFAPVAGTHMMIRPEGCFPVYYSATEPTSEAEGYQGVPIFPQDEFVVPRTAACWIFCPHEKQAVNVCVGALS